MPRPSAADVQIPGASASDDLDALRARLAEKDAQIAALSAVAGLPSESVVTVPVTQHGREQHALSKHQHLTCAQLHAQIAAGEAVLSERMVLCRDGWYVNPKF